MTTQANTTTAHNLTRLTLKSFKTVKWMSEETICFTAIVCIDGKAIGEASNEGHGGCTFIHYVNDAARVTAEAFAKSISPTDVEGWDFLADKGFTFDNLIDIAAEREEKKKAQASALKRLKKDLADKVVFVKAGECPKQGYRFLKCGAAGIAKGIEAMKAKHGNITVFNGLDDASLIAIFIA
jgi:hypothetical protein